MTKGGKMIQKIIFGILLIVWLIIIIFLFSSENAEKSTKTSDGFIDSITNILNIQKITTNAKKFDQLKIY